MTENWREEILAGRAPWQLEAADKERQKVNKFGWNPKVGDRVEGVGSHGGTGHFGTVVKRRRDGFVIEWDKGGKSVHQSYGFQKVEEEAR